MSDTYPSGSVIRKAKSLGWEPTNPNDWQRYLQALDYESPGDDDFLRALAREAIVWMVDNA